MKGMEMNERILKAYINGSLSHDEAHFVERQLLENEMWSDMYDGLLEAEKQGIDVGISSESH